MRVTFEMSELLMVLSLFFYSQSQVISVILLCLGLLGALVKFGLNNSARESDKFIIKNNDESQVIN